MYVLWSEGKEARIEVQIPISFVPIAHSRSYSIQKVSECGGQKSFPVKNRHEKEPQHGKIVSEGEF